MMRIAKVAIMHIIYDRNMFAVQATSVNVLNCFFVKSLFGSWLGFPAWPVIYSAPLKAYGLHYRHITIVNDNSRVDRMTLQVGHPL
jgi:hypothetical protein